MLIYVVAFRNRFFKFNNVVDHCFFIRGLQSLLKILLKQNFVLCGLKNYINREARVKKLSPKNSLIIGVILLVLSALIYWKSQDSGISSAEQAACEKQVLTNYGNSADALIGQCKTSVGFVAMMQAQSGGAGSARDVAQAISSANQGSAGGHMIYMFLMGLSLALGLGLLINGIKGMKK